MKSQRSSSPDTWGMLQVQTYTRLYEVNDAQFGGVTTRKQNTSTMTAATKELPPEGCKEGDKRNRRRDHGTNSQETPRSFTQC